MNVPVHWTWILPAIGGALYGAGCIGYWLRDRKILRPPDPNCVVRQQGYC